VNQKTKRQDIQNLRANVILAHNQNLLQDSQHTKRNRKYETILTSSLQMKHEVSNPVESKNMKHEVQSKNVIPFNNKVSIINSAQTVDSTEDSKCIVTNCNSFS